MPWIFRFRAVPYECSVNKPSIFTRCEYIVVVFLNGIVGVLECECIARFWGSAPVPLSNAEHFTWICYTPFSAFKAVGVLLLLLEGISFRIWCRDIATWTRKLFGWRAYTKLDNTIARTWNAFQTQVRWIAERFLYTLYDIVLIHEGDCAKAIDCATSRCAFAVACVALTEPNGRPTHDTAAQDQSYNIPVGFVWLVSYMPAS